MVVVQAARRAGKVSAGARLQQLLQKDSTHDWAAQDLGCTPEWYQAMAEDAGLEFPVSGDETRVRSFSTGA